MTVDHPPTESERADACPDCGEPDPIYYPPDDDDEDGIRECLECGWSEVVPNAR